MRKSLLLSTFAALMLASPAHAQFCPGVSPWVFDDVLASDPFCGFVTWMAENGITLGCQTIDANHRLCCPAHVIGPPSNPGPVSTASTPSVAQPLHERRHLQGRDPPVGRLVIAYYDATNHDLRIAFVDGMPLLVYSLSGQLSVIHCGARDCSPWARAR
jgi:hypothetical protein